MESVSAGYGDPDVSRSAPTDPGSAGDSDDPAEIDQLRRRLRDAQKELTDVFDRSALGLAMADFDGILTRVNPAFCAILGRTPGRAGGDSPAGSRGVPRSQAAPADGEFCCRFVRRP